jgi:hypothetical protein
VLYIFKCPKCGSIRESDHLSHGEKPCGRCKGKMEIEEQVGVGRQATDTDDPLEM